MGHVVVGLIVVGFMVVGGFTVGVIVDSFALVVFVEGAIVGAFVVPGLVLLASAWES